MIRLAICDDQHEFIETVRKEIIGFTGELPEKLEIFPYEDSKSFWYDLSEGRVFDIILLDIEMPGLTGIELAGKLRSLLPDVYLVFISSYDKYVFDTFRYNTFRFIPKEQLEMRLQEAICSACSDIKRKIHHTYLLQTGGGEELIPLSRIVMAWREGKNAVFQIITGFQQNGEPDYDTRKVRKTLKTVFKELPPSDFTMLNQMIVNLSQIRRVEGDAVTMNSGEVIYVPRGKVRDFKELYLAYSLGEIRS